MNYYIINNILIKKLISLKNLRIFEKNEKNVKYFKT